MASLLADAAFVCLVKRRRTLETNIGYIVPGGDPAERRRLARATLRNFALAWLDLLRLPLLKAGGVRQLVEWNTQVNLDAALAGGAGAVIVTPHLGAIELAAAYIAACGYRLSGVAEDLEPRLFDLLRRYRSCTGMATLSRRDPAAALQALRRGEVLAVVADRLLTGHGVPVSFCGGTRMMPTGPAALALRTGAPIVVAYIVRLVGARGSVRYRLVTEAMRLPGGTREDLTRLLAGDFSRIVRAHPDHWFVFQPNWIQIAVTAETAVVEDVTSSSRL
jgi:KDO2-lipid IV(A) lauroyltransferase